MPAALVEELKRHKAEVLDHLTAPTAPVLDPAPSRPLPAGTTALELVAWRLAFTGQTVRRYALASHPDLYARMLEHAKGELTPAGWEWAIVVQPVGELLDYSADTDTFKLKVSESEADPHITYGRNSTHITWGPY